VLGGVKFTKKPNLTNVYPNNNKNKVKSIPLELYELAGKNQWRNKNIDPGLNNGCEKRKSACRSIFFLENY
jgi:hypothetical protein